MGYECVAHWDSVGYAAFSRSGFALPTITSRASRCGFNRATAVISCSKSKVLYVERRIMPSRQAEVLAQEFLTVFVAARHDLLPCRLDAVHEAHRRGIGEPCQRGCRLKRNARGRVFRVTDADLTLQGAGGELARADAGKKAEDARQDCAGEQDGQTDLGDADKRRRLQRSDDGGRDISILSQ